MAGNDADQRAESSSAVDGHAQEGQAHDGDNTETARADGFEAAAGRARADLPENSSSPPAAGQEEPQYDRATETPNRGVPSEARQARTVSAYGYPRSTAVMLNAADGTRGQSVKRSAVPTQMTGRNRRRGK